MVYAINSSALTESDNEPNINEGVCKDGVDETTTIPDLDATSCYVDYMVAPIQQSLQTMNNTTDQHDCSCGIRAKTLEQNVNR